MNIFFDHQAFSLQLYGGISRYFCELINGINRSKVHSANLSLLWSNNVHLSEYDIKKLKYPFPRKHRLLQVSNQVYNYIDFNTSRNNIYHATYFNDFMYSNIGNRPYVVTFYDMVYERLSHKFVELSNDNKVIQQKKIIAQRASHLIAISESTKRDMVEILNIPSDKITVIHLGSSFSIDTFEDTKLIDDIKRPYFLYVGNRSGYKNFNAFLNASASLLRQYQISLICAGGGKFSESELQKIRLHSLDSLVKHVKIDDTVLPELYKNALAFVFPSLYEGFGIPILEAFSCNCPCIVSDNSSLPEVAGDAAIYIDPVNHESIVNALERVINDDILRLSLIQKGKQQLRLFSWQKTVEHTINLYESLV